MSTTSGIARFFIFSKNEMAIFIAVMRVAKDILVRVLVALISCFLLFFVFFFKQLENLKCFARFKVYNIFKIAVRTGVQVISYNPIMIPATHILVFNALSTSIYISVYIAASWQICRHWLNLLYKNKQESFCRLSSIFISMQINNIYILHKNYILINIIKYFNYASLYV